MHWVLIFKLIYNSLGCLFLLSVLQTTNASKRQILLQKVFFCIVFCIWKLFAHWQNEFLLLSCNYVGLGCSLHARYLMFSCKRANHKNVSRLMFNAQVLDLFCEKEETVWLKNFLRKILHALEYINLLSKRLHQARKRFRGGWFCGCALVCS